MSNTTHNQSRLNRQRIRDGASRFNQRYGLAVVASFAGLVVAHLPVIGLISLVPFTREVIIGAAVVATLSEIPKATEGAKFGVISGMTAAVIFYIVKIPLVIALLVWGSMNGDATVIGSSLLSGLGLLSNLVGLVLLAPVGFAVGGALGTVVNTGDEQ